MVRECRKKENGKRERERKGVEGKEGKTKREERLRE